MGLKRPIYDGYQQSSDCEPLEPATSLDCPWTAAEISRCNGGSNAHSGIVMKLEVHEDSNETSELVPPDHAVWLDSCDTTIPNFDYPDLKTQECCCCCDCAPPTRCYSRAIGKFWVVNEAPGEAGHQPQFKWVLGPCWPMSLVTVLMIVGLGSLLMTLSLEGLGPGWKLSGVVAVASVLYCFLATSCSDPGIVPHWITPEGPDWRRMNRTNSWVPKSLGSVGYCDEAGVLIKEYDHFCIWTGTAIGAGNMGCFMCMLKGIACILIYCVFLANVRRLGIG